MAPDIPLPGVCRATLRHALSFHLGLISFPLDSAQENIVAVPRVLRA